jgi:hypothetical protein
VRYLGRRARLLVAGMLSAGLPLGAIAFSSVATAEPCTDIPYNGCVVVPYAPVPEQPPGVSSDYGVPGWTPGVDLCMPLGGHQLTVSPICI